MCCVAAAAATVGIFLLNCHGLAKRRFSAFDWPGQLDWGLSNFCRTDHIKSKGGKDATRAVG